MLLQVCASAAQQGAEKVECAFPDNQVKEPEKFFTMGNDLMLAAKCDDLEEAKRLWEDGDHNMNVKNKHGITALMFAARFGAVKVGRFLLKMKALVDLQDNNGRTALIWATWYNHIEFVELLIDGKANLDVQSRFAWTALMTAVKENRTKIAKKLVNAGAGLDFTDLAGQTALMSAARLSLMLLKDRFSSVLVHIHSF